MDNFTDEEKRLIALSDEDNKRIISEYVAGEPFSKYFIRSLHLENEKRECLDYNEDLSRMEYYKKRVELFGDYIQTMKGWY